MIVTIDLNPGEVVEALRAYLRDVKHVPEEIAMAVEVFPTKEGQRIHFAGLSVRASATKAIDTFPEGPYR